MDDCTLHEAGQAFLEHLREEGKKERSLYTYARDLMQIEAFFGPDRELGAIRAPQVGKFLKSGELLRLPNGKERAKPTVEKTVRILRMLLVWAKETGRLERLPLPKDVCMGRSAKRPDCPERVAPFPTQS